MDSSKTKLLISIILGSPVAGPLAQSQDFDYQLYADAVVPANIEKQAALFDDFLRDGALDEAESIAKRRIEMAIVQSGAESMDTAFALTDLGTVQARTQQFDAAQQNFEAAIEIIVELENRLHELVVAPLAGLGESYLESGELELAQNTFRAAIHITHVNSGPHNIGQVELLESLAESQLMAGDAESARDTQDLILAITERYYEQDGPAMATSLIRRGEWLTRNGFYRDARDTFRKVVRIIESERGKNDPSLVQPLISLGRTYIFVDMTGAQPLSGTPTPTGEAYYKRAVRIAESAPATEWKTLATARMALGDFYNLSGDYHRARGRYLEAWQVLSEDASRHQLRLEMLGAAYPLTTMSIPEESNREPEVQDASVDEALFEGKVTATYMIDDRGRVTQLMVAEVEPPEFADMANHVERELRRRIFRPRHDETGAVATPSQVFTHRFQYRQAELDVLRARKDHADR
jgi:tetratricopeptide (TPR) repeat protein